MAIKQLLERELGQENRMGGIQVVVKTARSTVPHGKKLLQQVVLSDLSGDAPADVSLPANVPLVKGQRINIVVCWLQPGEKGPKVYVDQWFPVRLDAEGNEIIINGQKSFPSYGYDDKEEWEVRRDDAKKEEDRVIRSKVRYGLSCAYMGGTPTDSLPANPTDDLKRTISLWVDFIMTGE